MQLIEVYVEKISRSFDLIAGAILGLTATLVVANIVGRTVFSIAILGIHELVGFLTASAVGLSLAYCAFNNGNIAVSFFYDRLSPGLKRAADILTALAATVFLALTSYHLFLYGSRIALSGEVSLTTRLPFYPFIYLLALGMTLLCLVTLIKAVALFKGGDKA